MADWRRLVPGILCAVLLGGCTGEPATGPVAVRWDRDQCDRCRMVLSDRLHSAQVREPRADGSSRVFRFDDFGCAVIWLEDKPWNDDPRTEFWVTDYRTGEWLDARSAVYVTGQLTPMEYGLGAQAGPAAGGLDFAGARTHVLEVEHRFGLHGVHHAEPPPAAGPAR